MELDIVREACGHSLASVVPGFASRQALSAPFVVGVLEGEGIGPEVVHASLELLKAMESSTGLHFDIRYGGAIGAGAIRESGAALTEEVTAFCTQVFARQGAIFCGAGGGRFVYDLRRRFDLYCKLAPIAPLGALGDTGVLKPDALRDVDILFVRENTGGLYFGDYGIEGGDGNRSAYQRFCYSEREIDRIILVAANAARQRRGRLCVILKPGGVPAISDLWRQRAEALVAGNGIELHFLEIDNASYQLVADARSFDVVVSPNMFGDILADGAAVLLGSRGMSFSASFSDEGAAVYQTGHGAAHDLAGTDRANPVGQMLSLAMMLEVSFGLAAIAGELRLAIGDVLAAGWRTSDIMAAGCTETGTRALAQRIAAVLRARLGGSI